MLTRALAQNLVAIGVADFICRLNHAAFHCCLNHPKDGCCQDDRLGVVNYALKALGKDPWET